MADLRYQVDIDTRGAKQSLGSLRSSIAGIGAALGLAFGAKELVQTAARFEDLRTTLGFLFGDVETGAKAFEQIKKFATESIFTVEDLTNSVVKLKAAGLTPTIEQLSLFADVSSVATDSVGALQAITDLFARTTGGGLGLEDLNRLADRGIPVFAILKDKLNLARLEVSEFGKTSEGAAIILKALTEGLEETFSGSSAARANNLSQAFSNLEDAIGNTADIIGQAGLNKELGDLIRSLTDVIDKNKLFIKSFTEGLIVAVKVFAEQVKYLIGLLALVFTVKTITRLITAVKAFNAMRMAIGGAATAAAVLQGVTGIGLVKLAAGMAAVAGVVAGINEMVGDAGDEIKKLEEDAKNLQNLETGPLSLPDAPDTATGGFQEEFDNLKKKQDDIIRSQIKYFADYKRSVDDVKLKVEQEGKLLKMTEGQANVQRELNRFTADYYSTIAPLQEKITQLKLKDTEETKVQAEEIQNQIDKITELYNVSLAGLKEELQLREQINREKERDELFLNNQISLQDSLNDLVRESRQELDDLNLSPFQREIEGIKRQIDDKLIGSINNLKRAWKNGLITNDEYIKEMQRLEVFADEAFEKIRENAEQQREIQRSFAYGWKQAFESFADDATNAAKQAEKIFTKVTQGLEDTIVGFVKTGKLEFRSLVNDILETMLRSQIQQLIAKTFGAFGSLGGGSSFGNLFAGFFANGGMIPAGSFGVVGERGPELVSGPAQVTPFTGGNVTYNINAVDASSFKQLVARDPQFIHAVAQQGGRKVPSRR